MDNPSGKPPFSAIFDFSFTEFISIDLIRVLYVFAYIVAGLAMVGTILAGFSNGFGWGLGSIIIAPVIFFIIIFVALFINGTDYFVGGMAALATGPIMYFIFKRKLNVQLSTSP